jgi:hypothetical protein
MWPIETINTQYLIGLIHGLVIGGGLVGYVLWIYFNNHRGGGNLKATGRRFRVEFIESMHTAREIANQRRMERELKRAA